MSRPLCPLADLGRLPRRLAPDELFMDGSLGKPVITSNQVSLWSALKKLGIKEEIPGLGRLFTL
jgi:hypothetical protein